MTNRGFSHEVELLAAEINNSFEEKRAPLFEQGAIASWVEAINLQLLIGQIDVAEHGLLHLRARFPKVTYANRVGEILNKLPLAGDPAPFEDDPTNDFQVIARERTSTALLLFCGDAHDVGLPLAVAHRWIGRLNASLIYLRDFRRHYFLEGVGSIGATREATIIGLRQVVSSLGAKRIACYGGSSGAFGALLYGLDLGAEVILCLAGTVNMMPQFNNFSIYERSARELSACLPNAPLDLRSVYAAASRPPRVRIIYGGDQWDDRIHAEYMGTLPCVSLEAVENCAEHNVIGELIRRGQFERTLDWLIESPKRAP